MLIIKPKYLQERKSYLYNIFPKIWIVYEMLPILDLAQIGTYSKKKKKIINWIIWHSELIIQSIVIFYLFITWKLFTGQYKHIRPLAYGMIFKMFWQFWDIPKGAAHLRICFARCRLQRGSFNIFTCHR